MSPVLLETVRNKVSFQWQLSPDHGKAIVCLPVSNNKPYILKLEDNVHLELQVVPLTHHEESPPEDETHL